MTTPMTIKFREAAELRRAQGQGLQQPGQTAPPPASGPTREELSARRLRHLVDSISPCEELGGLPRRFGGLIERMLADNPGLTREQAIAQVKEEAEFWGF